MTTNEAEERFNLLADRWYNETAMHSCPEIMALHKNYMKIAKMGKEVLPLIFKRLQESPSSHWIMLLYKITKEEPAIEEKDIGNIKKIAEAWIKLGKKRGWI